MKKLSLGSTAKDRISGFRGEVVARTEYLYRSPRVAVAARELRESGAPLEPEWFDEGQIEELEESPTRPGFKTT